MSVTALEIEYGVLRSKTPPISLFYFRERPDYKAMSDDLLQIYHDKGENCVKLAKLKEKVRSRFDSDIKSYTPEINENGLTVSKDWADMVADDIIMKLKQEWGLREKLNWKKHWQEIQEDFRENRTIRFKRRNTKKSTNESIFVSSTFRDMHAERDALRDFVLPHVNEFAKKYRRVVELIDLRWGVHISEAEQNEKILRTCLDEIKRSRPFFLALIGDRYGSTLPRPDMEMALKAANFSVEDIDISITALEIEYAMFCSRTSKTPPISLFYFRERPDYTIISDDLRNIYHDKGEDCVKLDALKEKIRSHSGSSINYYTPEIDKKGLTVPKGWAKMVEKDIIAKLEQEWGEPVDTPLNWKEHEWEIQEGFRESRTEHFAGRTAEIEELTTFCLGENEEPQYLMIQGKSGSGKSGILCKVMDAIEDKCLLLPFCCGISPRSSLVENMLRYFISLLCEKLSLEDKSDEITTFKDLKERFIGLLIYACEKKRVVVIVDGLDQFVSDNEARQMLWMKGKFPQNFRVLCSIIDGVDTIKAFEQYGGVVRPIQAITKEDQQAIIHGIVKRNRKEIPNSVVECILQT